MKPLNIESNSLVAVIWHDSAFEMGWRYGKKPLPLPRIVTVGFVTHCTPDMLEIASTVGGKGSLNPLGLPFGMIVNIAILRQPGFLDMCLRVVRKVLHGN